jgi:hypothetical protein
MMVVDVPYQGFVRIEDADLAASFSILTVHLSRIYFCRLFLGVSLVSRAGKKGSLEPRLCPLPTVRAGLRSLWYGRRLPVQ